MVEKISNDICNIGVNDMKLDLFESQYKVPNGMSYNSYVIKDEKNVVFDTVDGNFGEEWMNNLIECLGNNQPDYLVILHLEPDHSANIKTICDKYPNMKLIGNAKTFALLPQFCMIENLKDRMQEVKEGDIVSIGKHKLNFIMTPMVHWPEVMMCYESTEKILFSADAFGKFGARNIEDNWFDEARRFYINIVAKYGIQVQGVLKKVANLDIKTICSLHGPVLTGDLSKYIEKYDKWSKYEPENPDGILVLYSSIHGNTKKAVLKFVDILKEKGANDVKVIDLTRNDMSEAIAKSFQYGKIILASSSYNAGVFPPMEQYLRLLRDKNFQKRKVAIIENGTWAPSAAKNMKSIIEGMKEITIVEPEITIKTTASEENIEHFKILANNIINN